jgi:hypothetical protein
LSRIFGALKEKANGHRCAKDEVNDIPDIFPSAHAKPFKAISMIHGSMFRGVSPSVLFPDSSARTMRSSHSPFTSPSTID